MGDFLAFRRMITPVLIQVVYWILTVVAVVVGFVLLLAGDGVAKRFLGLLILVIGPLVVRIYAEASILFFRMNQTLTEIKNNTERR
jgi:multisubunit Na+/H+ antiporter MnhG subunit